MDDKLHYSSSEQRLEKRFLSTRNSLSMMDFLAFSFSSELCSCILCLNPRFVISQGWRERELGMK